MSDAKKNGKSISILGCGWLGMPLAQHFVAEGYEVKGSTTTAGKITDLETRGIMPFLMRIEDLSRDIQQFLDADMLMIMITSKDVSAFKKLVSHIERSSVRQVLFVSSTSVYGPSHAPITEETAILSSPLAEMEELLMSNDHFVCTVIRFGGLIGPNRHPGRFFRSGKKVKNPDSVVNLIHRDDCIGIIDAIVAQEAWGQIFNGTADAHPTKRAFYTKAALDVGAEPPEFEAAGSSEMKLVLNDKVKRMLGYHYRFPDIMNATIE